MNMISEEKMIMIVGGDILQPEEKHYKIGQLVKIRRYLEKGFGIITRTWHDGPYYEYYVKHQDSTLNDWYSMYEICY